MILNKAYTIRVPKESDADIVSSFFIKAYGDKTVFQDKNFLKWFFNPKLEKNGFMKNCVIALDDNNNIISHYGGINYTMMIDDNPVSFVWGVNAYTLPEWRKLGISGKLVIEMINRHDMLGTIGMSSNAHAFYQDLKFNIFNRIKMRRYILNLDDKIFDIVARINQSVSRAKTLLKRVPSKPGTVGDKQDKRVTFISNKDLCKLGTDYDYDIAFTTRRDTDYLSKRFIGHPHIDYKLLVYIKNNNISAYIAIRREKLLPTNYYIMRIVDLYGSDDHIPLVIRELIRISKSNKDIFIDFSAFGTKYRNVLLDSGFIELCNDDACILPQVTSPIEDRPNCEFVALYSNRHRDRINSLCEEDVYFTRSDSDRDRLSRIDQIVTDKL